MADSQFEVGDKVKFLGYDDSTEEKDRVLEEGEIYTVEEVGGPDGDDPDTLSFRIQNPAFDEKKRVSKSNPETVLVDVFADEVELAEEEAPPAEEKPATRTRGAKASAKPAAAEEPEVKGRAKPAAKAAKATVKGKAKPAAKAKAKAEPVEKIDPLDVDIEQEDEEILKLVEEAGDELLDLAREMVEESSSVDYKLGGVLYHVRKSKAYQSLDDRYTQTANPSIGQLSGFQLYTQEQLGVDYRKAMELISIYVNFNLAGLSGDTVAEIGWTKASKIARVLKDQIKAGVEIDKVGEIGEELVGAAGEQSVTELSETIRETYTEVGGTKGEKKKTVKFLFKLFEDQAEGVKQVLESTMASMGFKKMEQAFEHIVMEWAAEHPMDDAPATKEDAKASRRAAAAATAKPGRTAGKPARASARA